MPVRGVHPPFCHCWDASSQAMGPVVVAWWSSAWAHGRVLRPREFLGPEQTDRSRFEPGFSPNFCSAPHFYNNGSALHMPAHGNFCPTIVHATIDCGWDYKSKVLCHFNAVMMAYCELWLDGFDAILSIYLSYYPKRGSQLYEWSSSKYFNKVREECA